MSTVRRTLLKEWRINFLKKTQKPKMQNKSRLLHELVILKCFSLSLNPKFQTSETQYSRVVLSLELKAWTIVSHSSIIEVKLLFFKDHIKGQAFQDQNVFSPNWLLEMCKLDNIPFSFSFIYVSMRETEIKQQSKSFFWVLNFSQQMTLEVDSHLAMLVKDAHGFRICWVRRQRLSKTIKENTLF